MARSAADVSLRERFVVGLLGGAEHAEDAALGDDWDGREGHTAIASRHRGHRTKTTHVANDDRAPARKHMTHHPLARLDSHVVEVRQCVAARGREHELVFVGTVKSDGNPLGRHRSSGLFDDVLTNGVDGSRAAYPASQLVDVDEQTVGRKRHRSTAHSSSGGSR
jgi:hypothetical protein